MVRRCAGVAARMNSSIFGDVDHVTLSLPVVEIYAALLSAAMAMAERRRE